MTLYRQEKYNLAKSISIAWQAVQTTGFTAVAGNGYPCNTTSGEFTATLPAGPSVGDTVHLKDYAGTFASNPLTIGRNSSNMQGVASDNGLFTNKASATLVYIDATKGWLYTQQSNVSI